MRSAQLMAIKSSPKPEHILDTMFERGETYIIEEDEHPDFYNVGGQFFNRLGGGNYKVYSVKKTEVKKYFEHIKFQQT